MLAGSIDRFATIKFILIVRNPDRRFRFSAHSRALAVTLYLVEDRKDTRGSLSFSLRSGVQGSINEVYREPPPVEPSRGGKAGRDSSDFAMVFGSRVLE